MAPRKKPTKLKLLEGNPGRRPLPKNEPQPAPVDGDTPPTYLNEKAAGVWQYFGPRLAELGLLTEADEADFRDLCKLEVEVAELEEQVVIEGRTWTAESGYGKASASYCALKDSRKELRRAWASFGGNPSARVGLSVTPPAKSKSKIAERLGG